MVDFASITDRQKITLGLLSLGVVAVLGAAFGVTVRGTLTGVSCNASIDQESGQFDTPSRAAVVLLCEDESMYIAERYELLKAAELPEEATVQGISSFVEKAEFSWDEELRFLRPTVRTNFKMDDHPVGLWAP